jgi:acyl carrier protein
VSDDLSADVIGLVETVTDAAPGSLRAQSRFDGLENWDSMRALRLFTAIEQRLGVRLDLRAYLKTADVAGLVELVAAATVGAV